MCEGVIGCGVVVVGTRRWMQVVFWFFTCKKGLGICHVLGVWGFGVWGGGDSRVDLGKGRPGDLVGEASGDAREIPWRLGRLGFL